MRARNCSHCVAAYQMPAYHLVGPNREGITLVNIGVGPSNAKTIRDHPPLCVPKRG